MFLVEQYDKEPVDGKFEDVTDTVLKDLESDADAEADDDAVDMEQAIDIHDDDEDTEDTASDSWYCLLCIEGVWCTYTNRLMIFMRVLCKCRKYCGLNFWVFMQIRKNIKH